MRDVPERTEPIDFYALALAVPDVVHSFDTSIVKRAQKTVDWSKYKIEVRNGNPFIVREMCDRCGRVYVLPRWRKIRAKEVEGVGTVYLEAGLCKTCINASVYVDCYLDGEPLTEKDAKALFYKYAEEYEHAWRLVLACAPIIVPTDQDWENAVRFFNGCAICGRPAEVHMKYFPQNMNGYYVPWNVLPMCCDCASIHNRARLPGANGKIARNRIFATHEEFNKEKTIRLYLLTQMRKYEIYMDPILPYMKRFREEKILAGSE